MTEAAKITLKELEKKIEKDLNNKAKNKTLGEASDDAVESICILTKVMLSKVVELEDPIVGQCSIALMQHLTETIKAIGTFNTMFEAAEIIKEQEKKS